MQCNLIKSSILIPIVRENWLTRVQKWADVVHFHFERCEISTSVTTEVSAHFCAPKVSERERERVNVCWLWLPLKKELFYFSFFNFFSSRWKQLLPNIPHTPNQGKALLSNALLSDISQCSWRDYCDDIAIVDVDNCKASLL